MGKATSLITQPGGNYGYDLSYGSVYYTSIWSIPPYTINQFATPNAYYPVQVLNVYQKANATEQLYARHAGAKAYELSDHLGNVTVTLSDLKRELPETQLALYGITALNSNEAAYAAQVLSYTNYYAFGMAMPGRSLLSDKYRYGFNGKENDKEWGQTLQDYGFRIYNPALGKFLSVDPLAPSYPMLTPYQYASNTPIKNVDMDGLEACPDDLLRRAINWGIARLQNYVAESVENLVVEGSKKVMVYEVDKTASQMLIEKAKGMDPQVQNYSESEKEKIFNTDAVKSEAILLYEFASGEGSSMREFNWSHPITKEIASGYVISEIQEAVADVAENMTYKEFVNSLGIEPIVEPIEFSPTSNPSSWGKSLFRHISSNKPQFFVGGAIATIMPSEKEGWVNVTISNSTSRNSLMLHIAKNYVNGGRLSTIIQKFTFAVKIDMNDFKEEVQPTENE